jgi:hypothetical protein
MEPGDVRDLIGRLALETWRLRRRLYRARHTVPQEEYGALGDSLSRMEDVLSSAQVEFRDHVGEPYNPGLQVEVLHMREAGERLEIVETIQPSIVFRGRILRQGQVIVGVRPETTQNPVHGGDA